MKLSHTGYVAIVMLGTFSPALYGDGQGTAHHLCVFVPISPRSQKDTNLAIAALQTWASPGFRALTDSRVLFLSPPGARVHPALAQDTAHLAGDVDTDYKRLPIRTFRMWSHLGKYMEEECRWFMKADADSYVNLKAVSKRLACFNSSDEYYFGVTHAILPHWTARATHPSLFFGHGGSGYIISQGLIGQVGFWADPCLAMTMESTQGDAMEDVAFAMCLMNRGIKVLNYGFTSAEFIVNYHQAREALLNSTGDDIERSLYWDAQPPPLGPCLLVVHPVEHAEDMPVIHSRLSGEESSKDCNHSPMILARQSEVKLHASKSELKPFWQPDQVSILGRCFSDSGRHSSKCEWRPVKVQCLGLAHYDPADSVTSCADACCASEECGLYQFKSDLGCWLGEWDTTEACELHGAADTDISDWEGGAKQSVGHSTRVDDDPDQHVGKEEQKPNAEDGSAAEAAAGQLEGIASLTSLSQLFQVRVRSEDVALDVATQDSILDLYADNDAFRLYCNQLLSQNEKSQDFRRRLLRRFDRFT